MAKISWACVRATMRHLSACAGFFSRRSRENPRQMKAVQPFHSGVASLTTTFTSLRLFSIPS